MSAQGKFASYKVGQVVGAVTAKYDARKTQPPARYTEDTLLDAMLNAYRFAKSDADREILRQTGLGTSRTRSGIIENLIGRQFISRSKRGKAHELISTPSARSIVKYLPEYLLSVATTAKWEVAFSMIEKGQVDPAMVKSKVIDYVRDIVKKAQESAKSLSGVMATAAAVPANPTFKGAKKG